MCEEWHWGEIAWQFDSPIIIGRLTTTIIIIIIIIVLYINRRMSLISPWLSTKTFAIVDISDYRRYTILSSIGTTLIVVISLLSMEGQRALRFHQKYLNFCSEDDWRSWGFGTTWGWVINVRMIIFGWTNPLRTWVWFWNVLFNIAALHNPAVIGYKDVTFTHSRVNFILKYGFILPIVDDIRYYGRFKIWGCYGTLFNIRGKCFFLAPASTC